MSEFPLLETASLTFFRPRFDVHYHPEHQKQRYNIFRRVWQGPMNFVEMNVLRPVLKCNERAHVWRYMLGRGAILYAGTVAVAYYFMYRGDDFTKAHTWNVIYSRPRVLEGDAPLEPRTKGADYYNQKVKDWPI